MQYRVDIGRLVIAHQSAKTGDDDAIVLKEHLTYVNRNIHLEQL